MAAWKEATGKAKERVERLYHSTGPGMGVPSSQVMNVPGVSFAGAVTHQSDSAYSTDAESR